MELQWAKCSRLRWFLQLNPFVWWPAEWGRMIVGSCISQNSLLSLNLNLLLHKAIGSRASKVLPWDWRSLHNLLTIFAPLVSVICLVHTRSRLQDQLIVLGTLWVNMILLMGACLWVVQITFVLVWVSHETRSDTYLWGAQYCLSECVLIVDGDPVAIRRRVNMFIDVNVLQGVFAFHQQILCVFLRRTPRHSAFVVVSGKVWALHLLLPVFAPFEFILDAVTSHNHHIRPITLYFFVSNTKRIAIDFWGLIESWQGLSEFVVGRCRPAIEVIFFWVGIIACYNVLWECLLQQNGLDSGWEAIWGIVLYWEYVVADMLFKEFYKPFGTEGSSYRVAHRKCQQGNSAHTFWWLTFCWPNLGKLEVPPNHEHTSLYLVL